MNILNLSTEQLVELIKSNPTEYERSLVVELFSRFPYWGMNTTLIIPILPPPRENSRSSFYYVRGYRQIIHRFTKNDDDYLKEAIRHARYIPSPDSTFGTVFRYRNVIFVDVRAGGEVIGTMFRTIPMSDFKLIIIPETEPYRELTERILWSIREVQRSIIITGTKVVRDNQYFSLMRMFGLRLKSQPLSPIVKTDTGNALERPDWWKHTKSPEEAVREQLAESLVNSVSSVADAMSSAATAASSLRYMVDTSA